MSNYCLIKVSLKILRKLSYLMIILLFLQIHFMLSILLLIHILLLKMWSCLRNLYILLLFRPEYRNTLKRQKIHLHRTPECPKINQLSQSTKMQQKGSSNMLFNDSHTFLSFFTMIIQSNH